jgi:hypothetical protein
MRMLEVPDETYARLLAAAAASGLTPVGWIAARLQQTAVSAGEESGQEPTQTLAERFAGRVGVIDSRNPPRKPEPRTLADFLEGHTGVINSGDETSAENHSKLFAEYLEQKRRDGRL